jgi:hypothetical protein
MQPEIVAGLNVDGNPLQSASLLIGALAATGLVLAVLMNRPVPVSSRVRARSKRLPLAALPAIDLAAEGGRRGRPNAAARGFRLPDPPGPPQRRAHLRRCGNPVDVLIDDLGSADEPTPAVVVERSMGGLCLSLDRPVNPGTTLRVRALHAPGDLPWVLMSVKRCRQNGERWEAGCQYLDSLPLSVVLLFG